MRHCGSDHVPVREITEYTRMKKKIHRYQPLVRHVRLLQVVSHVCAVVLLLSAMGCETEADRKARSALEVEVRKLNTTLRDLEYLRNNGLTTGEHKNHWQAALDLARASQQRIDELTTSDHYKKAIYAYGEVLQHFEEFAGANQRAINAFEEISRKTDLARIDGDRARDLERDARKFGAYGSGDGFLSLASRAHERAREHRNAAEQALNRLNSAHSEAASSRERFLVATRTLNSTLARFEFTDTLSCVETCQSNYSQLVLTGQALVGTK